MNELYQFRGSISSLSYIAEKMEQFNVGKVKEVIGIIMLSHFCNKFLKILIILRSISVYVLREELPKVLLL